MRVAITGGIAEGKSTVLGMIEELGYTVCSADQMARQLFDDPIVNRRIAGVLGMGPTVTRTELRTKIAEHNGLRRALNAMMHPMIHQAMLNSGAVFYEVPLLLEACIQSDFDRVWVVTCGVEEQLRRIRERYGENDQASQLLGSQLGTSVKSTFSDRIIRTNTDLEIVREIVGSSVKTVFVM